jgi:uncharacterized membrane protein
MDKQVVVDKISNAKDWVLDNPYLAIPLIIIVLSLIFGPIGFFSGLGLTLGIILHNLNATTVAEKEYNRKLQQEEREHRRKVELERAKAFPQMAQNPNQLNGQVGNPTATATTAAGSIAGVAGAAYVANEVHKDATTESLEMTFTDGEEVVKVTVEEEGEGLFESIFS